MSTGAFIGDAIRNITGVIQAFGTSLTVSQTHGIVTQTVYDTMAYASGQSYHVSQANIDASLQVPTALENRVASVSVFACVAY
jgi:hypothetical protein